MTDDELRRIAASRPGMCTYPGVLAHLAAIRSEHGPELTDLPDGDQVRPLDDTVAAFAEHLGLPPMEPWQRDFLRRTYELPERTVPAGHTGPLPEIPPECYGPDAVPLEPAEPLCPHTRPHACLLCDPAVRPRPAPRPPVATRTRPTHPPLSGPTERTLMGTWKGHRAERGLLATIAAYLRAMPRIWRKRAVNRWYDLRALLAGYCNHNPYNPIPGEGGGYAHWRCALRRGHDGMHRSRNYVWDSTGRTEYLPVPHWRDMPQQPWERSMTLTVRQDRQLDRWLNRRYAEMPAARR